MNQVINTDTLPDNITINESLTASSLSTKLPKNLKINGTLNISYTKITEIPEGCSFFSLYMVNTRITKLPDNLKLIPCMHIGQI